MIVPAIPWEVLEWAMAAGKKLIEWENRKMASRWLEGEVRRVVNAARNVLAQHPGDPIYLHYARGRVQPMRETMVPGFLLATLLPLPMGKSDEELAEWIHHELKSVPCHPEH